MQRLHHNYFKRSCFYLYAIVYVLNLFHCFCCFIFFFSFWFRTFTFLHGSVQFKVLYLYQSPPIGYYYRSIGFGSTNYSHVLKDNYITFFLKRNFKSYRCNIQNIDKHHVFFFSILDRVGDFFFIYYMKTDSTNQRLVQESVACYFIDVSIINSCPY